MPPATVHAYLPLPVCDAYHSIPGIYYLPFCLLHFILVLLLVISFILRCCLLPDVTIHVPAYLFLVSGDLHMQILLPFSSVHCCCRGGDTYLFTMEEVVTLPYLLYAY